ncbi:MAG: long-chain acyl-CoA synthetase [Pseudonocardiales bacterium]|jgi:long-chain acyl-CoA synthetase|nr:long-chain acyl-CoA synthetase [Pseudonocardiales bacterium]MDT7588037.1 long-chain acyl-CoA synthetase [Pseudonocardiales bacterium]MDT7626848.1 long-chain acyl-CoA synthetase [Pseudonocardiales bacterium]MDT7634988.1 long-chain acyl-CoA synthetase [Pseudonocardiales bacterium]MDT7640681.1 long-chain acyl-CoA synthetase [Pseudonocardiales bacterium]
MSVYTERPWLARYADGLPADIKTEYGTLLEMFAASVARAPDTEAIRYFDGVLTMADLDAASDALAVGLAEQGFQPGDRLAVYVQNNPAFVVGLLGAWKAGGAAVAINPMNKARELTYLLTDSGATALLCLEELYESVAKGVIETGDTQVRSVITASPLDWQTRNDPRLFADARKTRHDGTLDLLELIEGNAGRKPDAPAPKPDDIGILTYTSGTTGVPKGAMNTHATMSFNAQTYREWMKLTGEDSVLGVAPLFHITGLIGHVALALLLPCPLVLAHRFHPEVVLDAIKEHRPTFTVGAITVFISLAGIDGVTKDDFASFKMLYSGGAPIAPAVTDRFEQQTGLYIHNIYGLTETNSPSHGVPLGARAPVDPNSGALSVGVPVFNTVVRILGEDGEEVPVGEIGEIATAGPQVVPGYWNKPEATAASLPGGELRTGDVGFMDADGWFYLVDRKKDMINAAGYKVWPREVEDVLYGHPAVREAAVVGVPDEYRGETVKAFVSVRPGVDVTEQELIDYCKANMAAYKYPRSIEFIDELPKTTTGKILRRELRDT